MTHNINIINHNTYRRILRKKKKKYSFSNLPFQSRTNGRGRLNAAIRTRNHLDATVWALVHFWTQKKHK